MSHFHKFFFTLLILNNYFVLEIYSNNKHEDPIYEINEIILNGNEITKSKVIIRELAFKKKEKIASNEIEEKIDKSKSNLTNLNLFNFIIISHEIVGNKINFTIDLVERWYIWPYPILEISERNFNVWWDDFQSSNYQDFSRFNYGVFLNIENFRGLNDLLHVKFR